MTPLAPATVGSRTLVEEPASRPRPCEADEASLALTPATCVSSGDDPPKPLQLAGVNAIPSETNKHGEVEEQLWRDGNLHWGEKRGNGWTEKWQTQEGETKRFGSKRGRDVRHGRDWQERWEVGPDGVTRIEKRVTQRELDGEGLEVERWVERLDMTPHTLIETKVGEDRRTGRQWRVYAKYKLIDDPDHRRELQEQEIEEVWNSDRPDVPHPRRLQTIQLQPSGRVLKTVVTAVDETGHRTEEVSYEDTHTKSKWGKRVHPSDSEERVEEWTCDGVSGSYERKESTTRPGSLCGVVHSYDSATNEQYREDWGKERVDDCTQREWSSKWRNRGGDPWGEYYEKLETVEKHTELPLKEEQRNEKWWHSDGARHSERWTQVQEYEGGEVRKVFKFGHNDYGNRATEDWEETLQTAESASGQPPELVLVERRLEKNCAEERSVETRRGAEEHHVVEDKRIGQIDEWHLNTETGEKWGQKHGTNAEGVSWHERWSESESERWLEKRWKNQESEWGQLSGHKGDKECWFEKWGRDGQSHWRERNETDRDGNEVNRREGETWRGGQLSSSYSEKYGVTLSGEKWAYKEGYHEEHGDWSEQWHERRDHKSAEKRGSRPHTGDSWFEAWSERFDAEGRRVHQHALKEGSNAQGESWMETWTEEGSEKYTKKTGTNAHENWLEEWKEEADGSKWCRKWAQANHWA